MLFEEPIRVADKTTSTHVHVARSLLKYPFDNGCYTVNVTHVVFDGALFESLSQSIRKDHQLALNRVCGTLSPGEAKLLRLQSWFVATPCMDHCCQASVRWGLRTYLSDKDLMSCVWQVIESGRTCFASLVDYMPLWIGSRLVFRDWQFDHAYEYWTLMGFESDICEQLAAMQLRCEGSSICVAECMADDPSVYQQVQLLLLRAFKMHEWTDSRWLSVGNTSRAFVAAKTLGLCELVEFSLARGHSELFLERLLEVNEAMMEFFVVASVCTFPAEACLAVLLKYDRM